MSEKCSQCGDALLILEGLSVMSEMYLPTKNKCCSVACYEQYKQKLIKHEKIERMAWELYKLESVKIGFTVPKGLDMSWYLAIKFYNYAKEKDEEVNE